MQLRPKKGLELLLAGTHGSFEYGDKGSVGVRSPHFRPNKAPQVAAQLLRTEFRSHVIVDVKTKGLRIDRGFRSKAGKVRATDEGLEFSLATVAIGLRGVIRRRWERAVGATVRFQFTYHVTYQRRGTPSRSQAITKTVIILLKINTSDCAARSEAPE
jgi:hypothetical protein